MKTSLKLFYQTLVLGVIISLLPAAGFSQQEEKNNSFDIREQLDLVASQTKQASQEAEQAFDATSAAARDCRNPKSLEEIDSLVTTASRALQVAIDDLVQYIALEKASLEKSSNSTKEEKAEAFKILQKINNEKVSFEVDQLRLKTYKPAQELLHTIKTISIALVEKQHDFIMRAQEDAKNVQLLTLQVLQKMRAACEQAPQEYQDEWRGKLKDMEAQSRRVEIFVSYLSILARGAGSLSPQH